jgi:hypothetical protein
VILLKTLNLAKTLIVILLLGSSTWAKVSKERKIIDRYLYLHKKQFQKTCKGKTDHHAKKLYKNFLGDGVYIPFTLGGDLDKETIQDNLQSLFKRHKWLIAIEAKLKKERSLRDYLSKLSVLKKDYQKLLRIRHNYYLAKKQSQKDKLKKDSQRYVQVFLKEVQTFLNDLYFLQSFTFPVDHLYLRTEYDKYKNAKTEEEKRKANSAYFLRKVVEEGAVDKKRGRSDLNLRALIDSVYLRSVSYEGNFLREDLRYDIDSLLDQLENVLRGGKKKILSRLVNWKIKTKKNVLYYQNLLNGEKTRKEILKAMYDNKNKARYALRSYIYNKEADVYKYWIAQDELYRKLFALETILIHEVGRLDDNYGSERRDVSKIVIERTKNSEYNFLAKDDPLFESLKLPLDKTNKYVWLNALFKQGQFSFTYFFIPASRGIFCPDQSRAAKKLRRKNLKIALDVLNKYKFDFDATRYFSRASMLGRIDMAPLWSDYRALSEMPGPSVRNQKYFRKLYRAGSYLYLYSFTSREGKQYDVLKFKKNTYVYNPRINKFYKYRNPHLFRYFKRLEDY